MNALARGKAPSDQDRKDKRLMDLREELMVCNRILEFYRPDVMECALKEGKTKASGHARICQILEDQQVQILQESVELHGLRVGDAWLSTGARPLVEPNFHPMWSHISKLVWALGRSSHPTLDL